jgi:hypothetical protein
MEGQKINLLPQNAAQRTALLEDASPDSKLSIGLRVYARLGGKIFFGKVQEISYKNVSILLDQKFMRKNIVTVNWREVRVETAQAMLAHLPKTSIQKRQERETTLLKVKDYLLKEIAMKNPVSNGDAESVVSKNKVLTEISLLESLLRDFRELSERLSKQKELVLALHEECVKAGVHVEGISQESLQEDFVHADSKSAQKRRSKERRITLKSVREQTRTLLTQVLKASGKDGIDSTDIIKTMLDFEKEFPSPNSQEMGITSYRIMGMLSALSRNNEAEMVGVSRWRAKIISSA